MSILNSASSRSVNRGYEYFKENRVIENIQISDFEYKGKVQGTNLNPYNVIINTKHPKKSICDCPFANGNTICKHMVALFFSISPDDFNDYEDWIENDYEEDENYDEDYYEEYYDNEYYEEDEEQWKYSSSKSRSDFVKPIFFDEILENFINNKSINELKDILRDELKRNEEYTFNKYLQKDFKKYISDKNNIHAVLDGINKKFNELSHNYDYNNKDYKVNLLTKNDKRKISDIYNSNKDIKRKIDEIFLNPELTAYDDYKWIASFYRENNESNKVQLYCNKLESFFDTLKHYSIKNTVPKSNVLIILDILNNYSIEENVKLLIKNAKYDKYVDYIIEKNKNLKELYEKFYNEVNNEKYINTEKIARVFYQFYLRELDNEMYDEYLYYEFLSSKNLWNLKELSNSENFDYYINRIIKNCKDIIILEKVYIFLNNKEKLFNLLYKKEYEYRLISNIEFLKDNYGCELKSYFEKRFYEVLSQEKSRENYKRACIFIDAINKLNNGDLIIKKIIEDLKKSEYANRSALFDEINKIM